MSLLRRGVPDREAGPEGIGQEPALRLPQLSAVRESSARGARRTRRRGGGAPGKVLGDARHPVRQPATPRRGAVAKVRRTARPRRQALRAGPGLRGGGCAGQVGLPLRRPQRRERDTLLLRRRRAVRRLVGPRRAALVSAGTALAARPVRTRAPSRMTALSKLTQTQSPTLGLHFQR